MKYPYDDSNMRYDYSLHRYVLTKEGVFELLGVNLETQFNQFEPNARQRRAERFLKKVTNTVYDYIYEGSWNSQYIEYLLATCPQCRQYIQEMLIEQVDYVLENNFIQDQQEQHTQKERFARQYARCKACRGHLSTGYIRLRLCT